MSTARTPKKPATQDWHPADIVAAVWKAGWTLRSLSRHHGYASATTLKNALHTRYPKAERLIAEAIGRNPAEIWPSRYSGEDSTGPKRRRGRKRGGEKAVA